MGVGERVGSSKRNGGGGGGGGVASLTQGQQQKVKQPEVCGKVGVKVPVGYVLLCFDCVYQCGWPYCFVRMCVCVCK